MNFRTLDTGKIYETAERLSKRLDARFSGAGLAEVAVAVLAVTREAVVRAEAIRRPIWWLRIGQIAVGVLLLAALGVEWYTSEAGLGRLVKALDKTQAAAVYVLAVAVFLVTLEVRLKRRRALRAIHELRAMAHIVDMHQLTKDPGLIGSPEGPRLAGGALMTAADVAAYLHYCSELLSLVSKIGQLYVQDFPDAAALAAVDQFEALATGLTQKIWQKLMILDRLDGAAAAPPAVSTPP